MKRSGIYTAAGSAIGFLLLILDSQTALSGTAAGLELCIRTVIPSLFPFLFLSTLLTATASNLKLPIFIPLCRFLRIPESAVPVFLTGILGGYPAGAQSVRDAYSQGLLSRSSAERMLGFCNNAGPAFLFGVTAALFPSPWMPWALWCIHILSALAAARILPAQCESKPISIPDKPISMTTAMNRSLKSMAQISGWIILFRLLIAFCIRWFGWFLPATGQVLLFGLLELSNGCCALPDIDSVGLRFIFCSVFLSFGGLCVTMQTMSAVGDLSMRFYFPGKLLQTAYSAAIAALIQSLMPGGMGESIPVYLQILLISVCILPSFLKKVRNYSRNPAPYGV